MRRLIFVAAVCLAFTLGAGETPFYSVTLSGSDPVMDGKITDPVWQKIPALELPGAKSKTLIKMLRTNDALHIAFDCLNEAAPDLKTSKRGRDENVFSDECVELFLQPSDDYYQFAVNASGSVYDGLKMNGKWNGEWSAVTDIHKGGWTAEIMIPLKTVGAAADGKPWRANICRLAFDKKGASEVSVWDPPGHHKATAMLFFGDCDPSGLFSVDASLSSELDKLAEFLKPEDRDRVRDLRKSLAESQRKHSGVKVFPSDYLRLSAEAAQIRKELAGLLEKAAAAKILDKPAPPAKDAPSAAFSLREGAVFQNGGFIFRPDALHGFSYECGKIISPSGKTTPFFQINFSASGVLSAKYARRFETVFRVSDGASGSLYELIHVYRKDSDFWVGRMIRPAGAGLLSALETDKSAGLNAGVSILSKENAMGETFLLNGGEKKYPVLPMIADKREKVKFTANPGDRLVSNSNPEKALTFIPLDKGSLSVDLSVDSTARGVTAQTDFYSGPGLSFFIAPGAVEPEAGLSAGDWTGAAVKRSLEAIGPELAVWRTQMGEMKKKAGAKAQIPSETLRGLDEFNRELDSMDKLRAAPGGASLADWRKLGESYERLKKLKDSLEEKLAFSVAL
jgi:hypothetical protein